MGKRMRERLGDLPEPLTPIGGRALLEHQIELARKHGFTDIKIFACYRADLIESQFVNGSQWGVKISYIRLEQPLGTAAAVLAGFESLAENFLVLHGDTLVNVDMERIWQAHLASQADVTLLLHPNGHPFDSDLVETDANGWVSAFHDLPHPADHWFQNLVNAGLYVVRKSALGPWAGVSKALDFGKDLFPTMLRRGARLLGYSSPEYVKDIGTPERYDKICADFLAGVVRRSTLSIPQRAVFLDRDGTLIRDVGGLTSPEQLELLPGAASGIRELNRHEFRTVLITNQPVVAKGLCTEVDVEICHRKLQTLLGREHAFLDRIYYCPHLPEKGFPGGRLELKIDCDCRKPKVGMVLEAARDLNLALSECWLIGDTTTDVETARRAGLKSVLVHTGSAGADGKHPVRPLFEAKNVLEAVGLLLAQTRA